MPDIEGGGITILSLQIKDFQGIRAARLEDIPTTGLVVVQGPVGAGKTSILKAIEAGLGGKAHVHERAVNDAAENGFGIDIELTNGFRIDRHSTPANPKGALHVLGPDDGRHGQSVLDSFVGPLSFDPLSFLSLSEKKQTEIVLALDGDVGRAKRIDELRARQEKLREERRPYNSELQKIQRQKPPEGDRPEPIEISAELARMGELQGQERIRQDAANVVRDVNAMIAQNAIDQEKAAAEIERLEQELDEARSVALGLVQHADALTRESADAKDALEVLDDPTDAIAAVHARLEEADTINALLEPWKEWDRSRARLTEVKREAGALTKKIENLLVNEIAELADINMPIEGLEISPTGEVLWRERPLSLASGGESISIAIAIAFAVNPALKICMLDEANNIGQPQLKALDVAARKRGFQIWACRLEGEGHVTVEDGVAT